MSIKNEEMCVYSTTDYDQFKALEGNRTISPSNVERLIASMDEEQLIVPAIVNENLEVIDGQHRLRACKESGKTFYYIQVVGYGLDQVQRINAHMKNWNDSDYLDSFIDRYNHGETEFKNYVTLREFMSSTGVSSIRSALTIAYDGLATHKPQQDFRTGKFKFNNLSKADKIAEQASDFTEFFPKSWNAVGFLKVFIAMLRVEGYNHSTMIKNLPTQWIIYQKTNGVDGWRTAVSEIYNYRGQRNKKIQATDIKYMMEDIAGGK